MNNKFIRTAKAISDLTTITSRCYCNGQRIAFFSHQTYPEWLEDPFDRHKETLESLTDSLTCISTEQRFYYGILQFEDLFLVLGPVQDEIVTDDVRAKVAYTITTDPDKHSIVMNLMRNCPVMSVYSLIPLLMNTNNMIFFKDAGNKLSSYGPFSGRAGSNISLIDLADESRDLRHQDFDTFFTDIITRGDTRAMKEWIGNPTFREGKLPLAKNWLRNIKNNYIVIAAMFCSAAIQGGLNRFDALGLLISGVQQVEQMKSDDDIRSALLDLACAYTDSVHEISENSYQNNLSGKVARFIRQNIYSPLRIADIADDLYVSRGHLSSVFHAETGKTLAAYIKECKVQEACRLLETTDRPIAQISSQLSFSSQSHFTKVFRAATGMTPKEYRESRA